jgi:hypothetical protein
LPASHPKPADDAQGEDARGNGCTIPAGSRLRMDHEFRLNMEKKEGQLRYI